MVVPDFNKVFVVECDASHALHPMTIDKSSILSHSGPQNT